MSNLVFLQAWMGDSAGARETGESTLPLAREYGLQMLEASVLENIAFAEGAAGEYPRAIELAAKSVKLREQAGAEAWSSLPLAGVALWHTKTGNMSEARKAVQRLLADDRAILRGTDWPAYCYWVAAQVLRLNGRTAEAARALERARHLLQAGARELSPEDRAKFLGLPWHVEIQKAAAENVWPDLSTPA
jgi:tetratricopeptide (TPR) repeat protein